MENVVENVTVFALVSVVVFVVVSVAVIMVIILRESMCGLCGPHREAAHSAAALQ